MSDKDHEENLELDAEFVEDCTRAQLSVDMRIALHGEKINQSDLARRLGVSRQHVSKVINEERNLTIHTLSKMAVALNRRLEVRLIRFDEAMPVVPDSMVGPIRKCLHAKDS